MAAGAEPREVYRIAADMERRGERMYARLAESPGDEARRELFLFLAGEEAEHLRRMEELARHAESSAPPGYYDPERAMELLRGYRSVFDADRLEPERERTRSLHDAVDFAIRREMDSIMFYHEAEMVVPESSKRALERIIDEERKHFSELSALREHMRRG
jgi:rubrerythrin